MTKNPVEQLTSEFDINDAPLSARNLLTRGHIQDEITQMSGCAVTTRGRYMTPVERLKNTSERALYLYIQGPNKASLDIAIQKIDEIIRTEQMNTNNGGNTMKQYRNSNQTHYQMPTPPTVTSVEKVYVGIENVSPGFDLRGKLIGVRGTNLNYIRNETGAIVTLRGKGSLFIDPNLGTESTEPLHLYIEHSKYEGLTYAKQLALNLIETLQQEVAQLQPQVVIQPQTQLQIYSNQQIYPGPQQNTASPNLINFKPNAPPPQLNIPPPGVHIPQGPLITQTPPITLLNTTDMVGNSGLDITGGNNMIITNTGGQLMQTTNQQSIMYNNGNNPYQTLQFQIPTSTAQPQLRQQQFEQQQHIEQGQQHNFNQQNNQLITQLIPTQQMIQSVPPPSNTGAQQILSGNNGAVGQQHGTVVTVPMHSQFQIQQPGTTTTQLQVNPQTGQLQQINTTMIPTSQHHQVAFQIPIQQQQNGGQQYIQQQSQVLLQSTNQQPQQTIQLQQTNQQQIHQIPIQTTGGATVANTATIQQPMTIQQHQQQNQQYMTQGGGHHQIYATQQGLVLLQQNSTVQQQSISNYTTTIQQGQHAHGTHEIPIVTANINQQPSTINQQSTTINCIQQSQHDPTGVTTIQQKSSTTDQLILEQMNQQHHTVVGGGANHHHQGSASILQHNPTGQLTLTTADHQTNQTVATGTFGGNNQLQLFQQSQQHILCDQNATQNQHQDLQQSTNIQPQHNSIQFINQNIQQLHQQQNDLQKQNIQQQQSYLFMQPTIQTNNQQQHQITGLATSGDGHCVTNTPSDHQHQITFIQSGTPLTSANGQQIQFQSTFPISIQQIPSSSIGGGIINTSNTITTATSSIASSDQLENATLIQQPIDNNMIQIKEESVMPPSASTTGKKRKLSETDNNTSSSASGPGDMMAANASSKNNLISSATELSSSSSPNMKKSGVGIDQIHTGKPQQMPSNNNYNNQQKGNLTQCSSSTNTSSITSSSTVAVAAGNQKNQDKLSPQRHSSNQQWSQSTNGNNKPTSQLSSSVGGMMLQQDNKWQNNQQWMSLTTMAVTTTSTTQSTNTNGGRQQNITNPPQVQQIRPNYNQQKYQQYLPGNQLSTTTPGLNTGYQQKNNQQRNHYNNNQMNMQQVSTTLASSRTSAYPSATVAATVNSNHYLQTMNSRTQQPQGNWQPQQQHPNAQFNNPPQQTGGWM